MRRSAKAGSPISPGARLACSLALLERMHGRGAPADAAARQLFGARLRGGDRQAVLATLAAVERWRAALDWWIARAQGGAAPPDGAAARERARLVAALALLHGWSAARIERAFDGARAHPARLRASERAVARALAGRAIEHPEQPPAVRLSLPAWLAPAFAAAFDEQPPGAAADEQPPAAALTGRAAAELAALRAEPPLDLRANLLRGTREQARAALAREGVESRPTPFSPWGLRALGHPDLAATQAFRSGLVEVQDEGAQLVALLVGARPGERVADLCAGAGGKSLALAAAMENRGRLVACDVQAGRLRRSAARARRAGVHNLEPRLLSGAGDAWLRRQAGRFDRVLVDAPCSGTGAWRRNPEARWSLAPAALESLRALQAELLRRAARLVRPGGRLVYATCSLLTAENQEQVARLLEAAPDFAALPVASVWREATGAAPPGPIAAAASGPGLLLTPARHGTDGFFVAVLERRGGEPTR